MTNCIKCNKPIGIVDKKWEAIFILKEKEYCNNCYNKVSDFND